MKRLELILVLVILSVSLNAQQLNKLGKIEVNEIPSMPDHRIEKINGEFKILKDSFLFDGNTYFKIPDGYITCLQVVDNKKDFIKHYNSKGNLLVTILSDKIINLKVSENGNKLVYHDSKNIILVNLNGYKIDTLADSYVYEFVQNDNLIYYNPENKSIYFKNFKIDSDEYPNQFINYKGKVIVVTKKHIFELLGNSLFSKYEFSGKFFDAKIVGEDFYFVDKEEKRKSEIFSLFKTLDFNKFLLVDRLDDRNH